MRRRTEVRSCFLSFICSMALASAPLHAAEATAEELRAALTAAAETAASYTGETEEILDALYAIEVELDELRNRAPAGFLEESAKATARYIELLKYKRAGLVLEAVESVTAAVSAYDAVAPIDQLSRLVSKLETILKNSALPPGNTDVKTAIENLHSISRDFEGTLANHYVRVRAEQLNTLIGAKL